MLNMRSATQKGIAYFRYADDLLILARSEELAVKAFRSASAFLQSIGQRFKARKPEIALLTRGVEWLGMRICVTVNPWTSKLQPGYYIPDACVAEMVQRLQEMTVPPSAKLSEQTFDLRQWIISINRQLQGWHNAYQYAENFYQVARTLDDVVQQRFEELLMAVTGKRASVRTGHLSGSFAPRIHDLAGRWGAVAGAIVQAAAFPQSETALPTTRLDACSAERHPAASQRWPDAILVEQSASAGSASAASPTAEYLC
jgi:hypothetical protein